MRKYIFWRESTYFGWKIRSQKPFRLFISLDTFSTLFSCKKVKINFQKNSKTLAKFFSKNETIVFRKKIKKIVKEYDKQPYLGNESNTCSAQGSSFLFRIYRVNSFKCIHHSVLNKQQFLQLISLKICLTQIYSTIILRTYNICHYSLRYQSFKQILDADILNYSPSVMFRGTHCTVYITIF